MYKVIHNSGKFVEFETRKDAELYLEGKGRAKCFFRIEGTEEPKPEKKVEKKTNWKDSVDFTDAVNINRDNVKFYYNKSGYIKVVNPAGKTLHVGKTTNMGKVFSNYVNCARYNQSYDFDLMNGDRLYFKEAELN